MNTTKATAPGLTVTRKRKSSSSGPPPTLRWGIVGCGSVCEKKSGPAFYQSNYSSLVAVMRRDASKAEDFAKRHGVSKHYSSSSDLIEDEDVDAIYVATPPGGDRVQIAQMVAAAKKPCYMEKPLGRDANEAKQIASIFEEAGVPLYVAYYRRCMPKYVAIKRAMNDNLIGRVTGVTVTLHQSRHRRPDNTQPDKSHWHYDKEVSGGGLFMDVGCHMLDIVDFIVGPIRNAQGKAYLSVKDQSVEDNVRGMWDHTTHDGRRVGGSCVFNFSCGGPRIDEIEVAGTIGSLIISCFDEMPAELRLDEGCNTIYLDSLHPVTVQQPMIQLCTQDILSNRGYDVFSEKDIDPDIFLCRGESAVRTAEAMDRLLGREKWSDDYINS